MDTIDPNFVATVNVRSALANALPYLASAKFSASEMARLLRLHADATERELAGNLQDTPLRAHAERVIEDFRALAELSEKLSLQIEGYDTGAQDIKDFLANPRPA